jgi:hypothetical protein
VSTSHENYFVLDDCPRFFGERLPTLSHRDWRQNSRSRLRTGFLV